MWLFCFSSLCRVLVAELLDVSNPSEPFKGEGVVVDTKQGSRNFESFEHLEEVSLVRLRDHPNELVWFVLISDDLLDELVPDFSNPEPALERRQVSDGEVVRFDEFVRVQREEPVLRRHHEGSVRVSAEVLPEVFPLLD
jgi:hypothetical protein